MKSSEVMQLINEIEDKFPVDTWIIDNIHVWPLIRISLAYKLYPSKINKGKKFNKIKKLLRIFQGICNFVIAYIIDFKQNTTNQESADIVFLSHSMCRCIIDNFWYDRHCDPFINLFKKSNINSLLLEYVPNQEYRVPRYQSSTLIQHHIDIIRIYSYLYTLFIKPKASSIRLKKYDSFIDFLLAKNLNNILDISNLYVQVIEIRHLANYFKNKLIKTKLHLCFLVNYYGNIGMAFNLACRDLNLPSIDIQHGVQGEFHAAYASWNKLPQDGYELLPSKFWCWSDYEAGIINKWSKAFSSRHQAIIGGNLWINMWQENHNILVDKYDRKVLEIKKIESNSIHILFTLQPRDDLVLSDWILKVIKESPRSWVWWIRLHPGMMSERKKVSQLLKQCKPANIELNHATDLPLLALLRHTDVHVTYCSSTVIEAESFGVPSVITHIVGTEGFPNQIASGMAISAYTTEELLAAIELQAKKKITLNCKTQISSTSSYETLQQVISTVTKQRSSFE